MLFSYDASDKLSLQSTGKQRPIVSALTHFLKCVILAIGGSNVSYSKRM